MAECEGAAEGKKELLGMAIRKGLFKQKAFGLRKSVAFEGSL